MNIMQFLSNLLGTAPNNIVNIIYYIVGGVLVLILLDGIIKFLISGITSLTTRGRK